MRFDGQRIKQLETITNAQFYRVRRCRQQTVVPTAARPEPPTVGGESQAWHQPYRRHRSRRHFRRFADAMRPANKTGKRRHLGQFIRRTVPARCHDHRPFRQCPSDEFIKPEFVCRSEINGDRRVRTDRRQNLRPLPQSHAHRMRRPYASPGRNRPPPQSQRLSQPRFFHNSETIGRPAIPQQLAGRTTNRTAGAASSRLANTQTVNGSSLDSGRLMPGE